MILPIDGTEIPIGNNQLLVGHHNSSDLGSGLLSLRLVDGNSYEQKEVKLAVDRWSPEGFRIELWNEGSCLAVCAASGIVILRIDTWQFAGFLAFEYQECERFELPWFIKGGNFLLIGTETRVCCINEKGFFRWLWSVRDSTKPYWKLASAPLVEGTIVRVALTSFKEVGSIELELGTGFIRSVPRNWRS